MKKLLFLITTFFVFAFINNVDALSIGKVISEKTNLRNGPGTNYKIIDTIYYNDNITLLSTSLEKDEKGCAAGWYKAKYNNKTIYVCSSYITSSSKTVRVNTSLVNTRTGAGTNYSLYKKFKDDTVLVLNSNKKYEGIGCNSNWYQFLYNNQNPKYICLKYVDGYTTKSNVVTVSDDAVIKTNTTYTKNYAKVKYGDTFTLYDTKLYKGNNCTDKYHKILYKGQIKYICSSSVLKTNEIGIINNIKGVNIRNTNYKLYKSLPYNTSVSLVNKTTIKNSICPDGFYKIKLNGSYRYVCSNYVSLSDITTSTNSFVNIRNGAGTNYKKVGSFNKGDTVILTSLVKYKGAGCTSGYYKISYNGGIKYICSSYTQLGATSKDNGSSSTGSTNSTSSTKKVTKKTVANSSSYYYTTNKWTYRISEDYAYVYSKVKSGEASGYVESIYLGTEVKVLSTNSSWVYISYYGGKKGYVASRLVEKYSSVTKTDKTYCDSLKKKGFPESYCPYLSYLHSKYPKWVFKAEITNDTFENALNNESGKNYTQIKNKYYCATSKSGNCILRESGSWYEAKDPFVAYLIDPRNYLNEKNIFAFEALNYEKTYQNESAIKKVLGSSYLSSNSKDSEGKTYIDYFLKAANDYNISPIHLASRVKQEGGTNENYAPVSGKATVRWDTRSGYICSSYVKISNEKATTTTKVNFRKGAGTEYSVIRSIKKGDSINLVSTKKYVGTGCSKGFYKITHGLSLKGYYNYYNIGAFGDNPQARSLATAAGYVDDNYGTPWNTRGKAILNGARFIAEGYINKGQNTLFYQKFNVGPNTKVKYIHQYMSNIIAPASESLSIYRSYKDINLLNQSFVFRIPVYKNMPTEHTSHMPVGGTNAYLNALK